MQRSPALLDRDAPLAAVEEVLAAARAGRTQVAVVSGEAGIGKTMLLDAAARSAAKMGFHVARAAALELERGTPFRPLAEALDVTAGSVHARRVSAMLFGDEPTHDPAYLSMRISHELLLLLERLADQQPLLLCIDDLQWADDATLSVVGRALHRLEFSPFALVVGVREYPRPPSVVAFLDMLPRTGTRLLPLQALAPEASHALACDVLRRAPTPTERALLTKAGGNPLFVAELAADIRDGTAPADTGATLRSTLLRRMARLPAGTVAVLRAVSVLGSMATFVTVAETLAVMPAALSDPVAVAVDSGFLVAHDGGIEFRHVLLAEIVYGDMPVPVRAQLHGSAAEAVARAGAPAAAVARHRVAGVAGNDAEAIAWLRRAVEESLRLAPAVAADLAEQTLERIPDVHPERELLQVLLAESLLWSGRSDAAEALAADLAPRLRRVELRPRARLVLLRALLVQGRATDFVQLTQAEMSLLPEQERAWALAESAYCLVEARHESETHEASVGTTPTWSDPPHPRYARIEALAQEAFARGQQLGDRATTCLSLCARSSVLDGGGHFAEAIELSRQAVAELEKADPGTPVRVAPHFHLGLQLLLADRVDEAEAVVLAGLQRAEAGGSALATPLYHHLLGRLHFAAGRWDDAVADWETALALAAELGAQMIVADAANCYLAQIALHRGALREAEARTTAAERAAAAQGGPRATSPLAAWARALLHESRGRHAAAAGVVATVHATVSRRQWLSIYRLVGADFARIAATAGDTAVAGGVAEAMAELARRSGSAPTRGAALLARAAADDDAGLAVTAVAAYEGSPLLFEQAQAADSAGRLLLAAGRTAEATPLLTRARAVYDAVGAARLVHEADRALAAAGVVPRRSGRRARPATGWESLTDSERRVADLVAQGLSNAAVAERLVISPRTVHTHVGHIFAKLGLTSRSQLAAQLAARP